MLVHDPQTGYFHDAPVYSPGYGEYGQVIYDGLGNPIGFSLNPADWVNTAVDVAKGVASNIPIVGGLVNTAADVVKGAAGNIPIVGGMVSNLIPGSSPPPTPPYPYPQTPPYPAPQIPPSFPGEDMVNSMSPEGFPYPAAPSAAPSGPWPYGWRRYSGPWTGLRRMLNWRHRGRYGHWRPGWGRSRGYGYGHGPWRAGHRGLYRW